jgi:actin-related protein
LSTGRTTGITVKIGHSTTTVTPIDDGSVNPCAIFTAEQGGADIQKELTPLLEKSCLQALSSMGGQEIVRDIREKMCYVAMDVKEEKNKLDAEILTNAKILGWSGERSVRAEYELPDGQIITLGAERFSVTESIFDPSLLGMKHEGIQDAVLGILRHFDNDVRKVFCTRSILKFNPAFFSFFFLQQMLSNIVLGGGGSMFEGLSERLHAELSAKTQDTIKVRLHASRCSSSRSHTMLHSLVDQRTA